MDPSRQRRKEEINHALRFIESSLAYPDPEGYKDFLTKLVCNLLDEGNAFFRDGAWEPAIKEFTEALNVSSYAETSNVQIPVVLLESLYVNRATAYHSMADFEQGVQDCDSALKECSDSRRALYRKALCLKELGQYKDAYQCTTNCLLLSPQDKQVLELAQELSVHLGLRTRKPYVSTKRPSGKLENDSSSLPNLPPVSFPSMPQASLQSSVASCRRLPVSLLPENTNPVDDSELIGDDLDSYLDSFPTEPHSETAFLVPSTTSVFTLAAPPGLPDPTPQLPPAFFSSPHSHLNSLDSFSATPTGTLDILDDLSAASTNGSVSSNLAQTLNSLDTLDDLDDLLDEIPNPALNNKLDLRNTSLEGLPAMEPGIRDSAVLEVGFRALDLHQFNSLDSFDSFPSAAALPSVSVGVSGLDSLSDFSTNGVSSFYDAAAPATCATATCTLTNQSKETHHPSPAAPSHPLSSTHEFLQACATCFPQKGVGIYSYVHKQDLPHQCQRNILLCRRKDKYEAKWTRVRRIPTPSAFTGPFVLCREVLNSEVGLCKYGEKCTFAYNQLEIDVWTEERKGTLDRDLLFEPNPLRSIIHLLQENKGTFMYLCQICYNNKPRIISKRSRNNPVVCSNVDVRHNFDTNKCLAFVVRSHNVTYGKIRPLIPTCCLDLCSKALRYDCEKEENCPYAHSVIELKTWKVQRDTGIRPDEIIKVSEKHEKEMQNLYESKAIRPFLVGGESTSNPKAGGGDGKNLDLKMKFVCKPCLRDGHAVEPNKGLKHCSAKAKHAWTKDTQVLLVRSVERSKWVQVRPLPHVKHHPAHYDICTQILRKGKCTYPGNCTFAHSQEEKKMWTYMKSNELWDMQQMYDMWLSLTVQNRQEEPAQHASDDRDIVMPTDHAEPLDGFHCRLCGRHSNSERQWQKHISTEKHKDRVFSCEGEDDSLTWSHRFPGPCFELCPKLTSSCPDGMSCDYAHSGEELQEWIERRDYLRQKLAKAREDMLIMPDEFDFGKYNFLLQD